MIDRAYAIMMARYNLWQNQSLYAAADSLSDDERRLDRGAFFLSIHGTLNHLMWGDARWMHRFAGWENPAVGSAGSAAYIDDWAKLRAARIIADNGIVHWAEALRPDDFSGELRWRSGVHDVEMARPRWTAIAHFFNHQTHHRGQVHAMLTAAGARPDDTDLIFMTN